MSGALHRFDARFLLPDFPRTVYTTDHEWRTGFEQVGVRPVGPHEHPDLVVAPQGEWRSATRIGARMLLADGRGTLRTAAPNLSVRRYVPVQARSGASVVFASGHRRAGERAVALITHGEGLASLAKRAVARGVIRAGMLPVALARYGVVCARPNVPALVREAAEQASVPASEWFLLSEHGADHKRPAFFLLDAVGASTAIVKFSRVPGDDSKGDRELRGLDLARSLGSVVTEHAPALLAQFRAGGHQAIVQTAASGQSLGRSVSARGSRGQKLARVEPVIDWLCAVARTTTRRRSGPPERLARIPTSDAALIENVSNVPAVFQHGDLSEGNVIVGRDSFTVVDWELATDDGIPLWDVLALAVSTLPLIDAALYEHARDRDDAHVAALRDLFHGRSALSPVLIHWLRRGTAASALDPKLVPTLVTLWFLSFAEQWAGFAPVERFAEVWLADPALGSRWELWSRAGGGA